MAVRKEFSLKKDPGFMALGYFTTDMSKDKQYNKLLVCMKLQHLYSCLY